MGVFNKLKNILFEEEIEEDTIENHPQERKLVKKEEDTVEMDFPKFSKEEPKKEEKISKYDFEEETDKELFESQRTFDFPAFDEDEFEDLLPKKHVEPRQEKKEEPKEERRRDFDTPRRKTDYTAVKVEKKEEEFKLFKPSPVISPVYGILDKNYKKEDVMTRDEKLADEKIKLDVDSVRKKAFGTLEENLDTTISEPTVTFYEEVKEEEIPESNIDNEVVEQLEEENLDNLLDKTVDVEIDVTKEMELPSRSAKVSEEIEELEEKEEIDIPKEEKIEDIKEEAEEEKDDENDLFDLIDSMYENKEED